MDSTWTVTYTVPTEVTRQGVTMIVDEPTVVRVTAEWMQVTVNGDLAFGSGRVDVAAPAVSRVFASGVWRDVSLFI